MSDKIGNRKSLIRVFLKKFLFISWEWRLDFTRSTYKWPHIWHILPCLLERFKLNPCKAIKRAHKWPHIWQLQRTRRELIHPYGIED